MWVPQWPLSQEKLEAVKQLVQEQLHLDHIEPSVSPWNTPIFVIKKPSGKWRLLHDLRAVNNQMQIMGPTQRGFPLLSALPRNWPVMILDIKDCFFSIPLCKQDRERFAFTIPSINHEQPDARFQWRVLPQGMANSPTMCQLFVDAALLAVRQQYPDVRIIHYMDDILLATRSLQNLEDAFQRTVSTLEARGLVIAPEKVQRSTTAKFLGMIIQPDTIRPQKVLIRTQHLTTLNDFQKLLGDINWVRGYLHLPRSELLPLFSILEGNPDVTSPRALTPAAKHSLRLVEEALSRAQLNRYDPSLPISLCILKTRHSPTGVLWQDGPLWWLHDNSVGMRTLNYYPALVALQAMIGIKFCLTSFAKTLDKLIIPYTKDQVEVLAATVDDWAVLLCSFSNIIDNHFPKHPLLSFVDDNLVYFPKVTSPVPLVGAVTIFTDGSKTGKGAMVVGHQPPQVFSFQPDTPQATECLVVLEVFKKFSEPFNLFSDSQYVVNAVSSLEVAASARQASPVSNILLQIQHCILQRSHSFFVGHVRAHTLLPGFIAKGNEQADLATRALMTMVVADPIQQARDFHNLYHVPTDTLRKKLL